MQDNQNLINVICGLTNELQNIKQQLELQKKPVYTNKDVMEMLDVSSATLKRWRNYGFLSYTQVGSTYFYSIADINEFLEKNHNKAYAY